ncbi:hypothetical protein K8I31_12790 [bacterium]|nr:hypothetical protein [bacterium]
MQRMGAERSGCAGALLFSFRFIVQVSAKKRLQPILRVTIYGTGLQTVIATSL